MSNISTLISESTMCPCCILDCIYPILVHDSKTSIYIIYIKYLIKYSKRPDFKQPRLINNITTYSIYFTAQEKYHWILLFTHWYPNNQCLRTGLQITNKYIYLSTPDNPHRISPRTLSAPPPWLASPTPGHWHPPWLGDPDVPLPPCPWGGRSDSGGGGPRAVASGRDCSLNKKFDNWPKKLST